jgi:hypothetical protein
MLNTPYGNKIADLLERNQKQMFANQKRENEYFQPFSIPSESYMSKINNLIGGNSQGIDKSRKRFFDAYEKDIREYGNVVLADSGDNKGLPTPPLTYKGHGIDALSDLKVVPPKNTIPQPFLRKNVIMNSTSLGDTSFDLGLEKNRPVSVASSDATPRVKGAGLNPSEFALRMSAGGFSAGGLSAGRYKKGVSMNSAPKQLNAWMEHVKTVKSENPNMIYKDVLKKAKETYSGKGYSAGGLSAGLKQKKKGKGMSGGAIISHETLLNRTIGGGMSAGGFSAGGFSAGANKLDIVLEKAKKAMGAKPKKMRGGFNLIDQNILQGTQLGGKKQPPAQLKKWLDHVKKVKSENPNMIYKDVLKKAKQTFK